jgi:hypothetical protein
MHRLIETKNGNPANGKRDIPLLSEILPLTFSVLDRTTPLLSSLSTKTSVDTTSSRPSPSADRCLSSTPNSPDASPTLRPSSQPSSSEGCAKEPLVRQLRYHGGAGWSCRNEDRRDWKKSRSQLCTRACGLRSSDWFLKSQERERGTEGAPAAAAAAESLPGQDDKPNPADR